MEATEMPTTPVEEQPTETAPETAPEQPSQEDEPKQEQPEVVQEPEPSKRRQRKPAEDGDKPDPETERYRKIVEKVIKSRQKHSQRKDAVTDISRVRHVDELLQKKEKGKLVYDASAIPQAALQAAVKKDRSKLDDNAKRILREIASASGVNQTPATVAAIILALRGRPLP